MSSTIYENISFERIREEVEKDFRQLDLYFLRTTLFVFGAVLLLSFLTEVWDVIMLLSIIGAGVLASSYYRARQRNVYRYTLCFSLAILQLELTYLLAGAYYAQFGLFILLTALIMYQTWHYLVAFYGIFLFFNTGFVLLLLNGLLGNLPLNINNNIDRLFNITDLMIILVLTLLHLGVCLFAASYLGRRSYATARSSIYLSEQLNIEANKELAQQISEGNYEEEYHLLPNDELGQTLLKLRDNISEFQERERISRWMSTGLNSISDILLSGSSQERMANKILRELVRFTNAQYAAAYTVDKDEEDNDQLRLLSAYANNKRLSIANTLDFGEGAAGESIVRKETMRFTDIPEDFKLIGFGVGELVPAEIVVIPLKTRQNVIGVIEVASVHAFADYQIDYLEQVSENIALTFGTTREVRA